MRFIYYKVDLSFINMKILEGLIIKILMIIAANTLLINS